VVIKNWGSEVPKRSRGQKNWGSEVRKRSRGHKNWGSEVAQTPDRVLFDPIKKTKKPKTHYDHLICVHTWVVRERPLSRMQWKNQCVFPHPPNFVMNVVDC
jgi:hypothetical protein